MYNTKLRKSDSQGPTHVRASFCRETHGVVPASFPRPRCVRFLMYFIIRVIFVFLLSLAQHVGVRSLR